MTLPAPSDPTWLASPEGLARHREFVRAIARELVADPAQAEDVAQQTLIAAWRRPPRHAGAVRPWLARVAKRFAWRAAGREREQRARELRAARPEASESSAEVDFEVTERLVQALRGLAEPYRSTVHLRYWRDLTPTAIARDQGVSVETVKTRLKRGLGQLRSAMDERCGSRAAWGIPLAALADPRPPVEAPGAETVSAPSIPDLVSMAARLAPMKLVHLAALAGATVLVALIARGVGPDSGGSRPPAETAAAAGTPKGLAARSTEVEDAIVATAAEGSTPRIALEPPVDDAAVGAAPSRVGRLRVLDQDGAPVAGAVVEKLGIEDGAAVARRTGSDGRLELNLPNGAGSLSLAVSAPTYFDARADIRFEGTGPADLGVVHIVRGAILRGVVTDDAGAPLEEATVFAVDDSEPTPERFGAYDERIGTVRTDASGTFELTGLRPGLVRVWSRAPGHREDSSEVVELAPGAVRGDLRVVLQREVAANVIAGRVDLPEGIDPVTAAVWTMRDTPDGSRVHTVPVDGDGRFRATLEAREPHDLWVQLAPSADLDWRGRVERDVPSGTEGLVLRVEEAPVIELDVVDGSGDPIAEFTVSTTAYAGNDLSESLTWVERFDGAASVSVPATAFYLLVTGDGYDRAQLGPFQPDRAPALLSATLERAARLRGQVLADGSPVGGATVELLRRASVRHHTTSGGFPVRMSSQPESSVRTGEDGTYELTLRGSGDYFVRAELAGLAPADLGPLSLSDDEDRDLDPLLLTGGGAIEGRILVTVGESPAGLLIGASRGDARAQTVTVGPDGRFRFEGLTPGPWWVGRPSGVNEPTRIRSSVETVVWEGNCEVEDGRTTTFDLDLRGALPTTIEGTWRLDGRDLAGWSVSLRSGGLQEAIYADDLGRARVAEDGSFELVAPEPGSFVLLVEHDDFPVEGLVAMHAIEVTGGVFEWSGSVPVGELRARFEPGDPRTPADFPDEPRVAFIVVEPTWMSATALMPGEDGFLTSRCAPAGRGDLRYSTPASAELPPIDWPLAESVTVSKGAVTTRE